MCRIGTPLRTKQPAIQINTHRKNTHMESQKPFFAYLPVSLFGSIMGLSGLTIAWKNTVAHNRLPEWIVHTLALLTVLAFIALSISYLLKAITHWNAVQQEWRNPVSKSFFGTIFIALLLLPLVIFDYAPKIAYILWIIGTILMLLFAVYMVGFWIEHDHEQSHITPAWIIPVVGTLDIPLASHLFGNQFHWLNVSALSIGLFFTLPLITLILSRIFFFQKLPNKLMPSLMILIAPFAVGALAYQATFAQDTLMFALYIVALFLFIALSPQLFKIAHACPFRVTWWAIGFPLAALLNATFSVANWLHSPILHNIGILFLGTFSLIFLWLIGRTFAGIFSGEMERIS